MKTCTQFATIRQEYEREIRFLSAHSERHAGRPAAKSSAKHSAWTKTRMARALSGHFNRCLECG
ncbi:hypothetical protein SAZ_33045 [Streptomyces noursei ZPM]|uniref:Transposase n=1 Tax=Streptomyces noursei TaxID=1971 RepID=A0A401RAB3_STRNR|nr:hypothetical protein [Streptomyces noursei]AKA06705.1 hypothetical protein SAZ_33045 [Streptomyces noursei ZPM]EOT04759.1 hypothetical protein K530_07002 [Streptomyces noursei CCRC 11814]EXU92594.1 hypothetical protein P354_15610 [Streptomyces noursei PD-1]MCE4948610.1 hypothetical protein [Streptomyces noursei]MCZ0975799.1 hypothetical protein [Streptomyces noursei]